MAELLVVAFALGMMVLTVLGIPELINPKWIGVI